MTPIILNKTVEAFTKRFNHVFERQKTASPLADLRTYSEGDITLFVNDLILGLAKIEVSAKINFLSEEQLSFALNKINTPFILFEKSIDGWLPIVLYRTKGGELHMDRILESGTGTGEKFSIDFTQLIQVQNSASFNPNAGYLMVTGLSWKSMVSYSNPELHEGEKLSPVQRLFRLLSNESVDIGYIYVYAIVIGLISMTLPIGVQSIINLISSGQFFNSIYILIFLVVLGVLLSGGLQIMQMILVETLKQRVFSKAAYELAYRIPRFKMESLAGYYPPELMNRFFEVVNIQKGLPKLLIELTAGFLQIVFGLLLLSFYHPFFIVFSGFLVLVVLFVFKFTGAKGLETNLLESKYKYKLAEWFEELARTLSSFKLAGNTNLPLERTDSTVNKYLIYRKKHFRILLFQYGNVLAFKVLVTAGILVIGCWLVVERQITLGQFVASELVVIIVVNAFEKIILGIDVVYDLLTAVEKLGDITDIPLEKSQGFVNTLPALPGGMELELKDFSFSFPNSEREVIQNISIHIPSGSRFCISGYSDSGKETLSRLLGGLYTDFTGHFSVNGIPFRDLQISYYRDLVSKNFDRTEIIDGTILENITLSKPNITYKDIVLVLQSLNLMDDINRLPNGILTELSGTGSLLSTSVLERLILARCLIIKPALLLISYPILMLERSEQQHIYRMLLDKSLETTVGFISNDVVLQSACDLVFVLDKGRLIASGSFSDVKSSLKDL